MRKLYVFEVFRQGRLNVLQGDLVIARGYGEAEEIWRISATSRVSADIEKIALRGEAILPPRSSGNA